MTTFLPCYLGGNSVAPSVMQYELNDRREIIEKNMKKNSVVQFTVLWRFKFHKTKIKINRPGTIFAKRN